MRIRSWVISAIPANQHRLPIRRGADAGSCAGKSSAVKRSALFGREIEKSHVECVRRP